MTSTKLTGIERQAIKGILDSDYMDGDTGDLAVNRPVWTWSGNPFASKRTFSGAVSSLVQKGFVHCEGFGNDACISITRAGMDAFLATATEAASINPQPSTSKETQPMTNATPTPTAIQAAMIKVLVSKRGATRPEMQAAAGSKTMPNAHFLNLMADRFGFECYADKAPRSDLLVYQFVKPGAKPTAYDAPAKAVEVEATPKIKAPAKTLTGARGRVAAAKAKKGAKAKA
jgi:hypothetical protein